MKTAKRALALALWALAVIGVSVWGTLAYLTDQETVTNTFTVGSVHMTLDEADVNPDGTLVLGKEGKPVDRVKENAYHLLPGHTYTKDPIIHVDGKSEDCYVFVKVENAIAAYESKDAGYTNIAGQITANGWTALDGVDHVFYKTYTKGQDKKDLEVFQEFKIDGMANTVSGWDAISPETTKVSVTGYAVQKDGFATAKAAWDAAFGAEGDDALVVTTTEEFTEAYKAGGSIKLGDNVGFSQSFDPATATSDIVLDLNGKTLTVSGPIYAYRKMTIMDSQGGGVINASAINGNEITITGGTVNATLTNGNVPGNYTITGGTFHSALNMKQATITGGTFTFNDNWLNDFAVGKLYNSVPPTHQVIENSDGSHTVTAK